jgi:uncharacterized RDD family membrane protein YckC
MAGHVAAENRAQAIARRVHGITETEAPASPYVGLITRLIAFALDALVINTVAVVVGAVGALIFSILPESAVRNDVAVAVAGIAFALWIVGYFVAFWTTTGQTPGNRLMEIRVIRADGSRLLPRHAIVRLFGIVLSAPLLWGFLPILVTDRRRGLQDWLAGTVVVVAVREPE